MDELWQRFRSFFVPVLYGVGGFLLGLIVVHMITSDPEKGVSQNDSRVSSIKRFTAPTDRQISGARQNIEKLRLEVDAKAKLLDQRHGDAEDPLEAFVKQALRAAFLRGSPTADRDRFDDDDSAARQAATKYATLVDLHLNLLRTQDPNVAFSRLRADVVQELLTRANRADVDVAPGAEAFGLEAVASIERGELPRRLSNLALIATVLDVAIREGVRSIDGVSIEQQQAYIAVQTSESYLSEWPVKIDVTGTPDALTAILNVLTDPIRPTPLGTCSWKQTQKRDGFVKSELRVYSVRVRPEAKLGLESEGE